MDLTSVAVVWGEPGTFETFVNEGQGRSSDEMSAAALVLSSSPDVQVHELLGNLLCCIGTCEPLVLRVVEAPERGEGEAWERALLLPLRRPAAPRTPFGRRALWVEAASVGPDLEPEGGIQGQFQLSDASGATIWNEGRPTSRRSRAAGSSCWTRRRTCGRGTRAASIR
ncbi:hypothetical protein [Lentzea albidocapillata]|uniref:hypothetical protein n=1 Tax=Lentzea albidocapillata TaxID=40571 RepID=UPI000B7EA9C2|nr:hypothetical protein [Lentzea albidocapillata]